MKLDIVVNSDWFNAEI